MKPDDALGYRFRVLNNLSLRHTDHRMESQGLGDLTGIHGWVARYLMTAPKENITQKEIQEALCIQGASLSRIVTLMENNGYVVRDPSPDDRRVRFIRPTEKLKQAYPLISAQLKQVENQMRENIDPSDMETCLAVLKQIEKNLDDPC